jgi:hypothetical protein
LTSDEATRWLARAHWRRRGDVEPGRLETWLAAARATLAGGAEPCKRERHKAMFELTVGGGAPDFLLKIERHAHASRARRLAAAPAVTQLGIAETLAARGIATPVPVAAGSCRRYGFLEASLLLVPIVPGAIDLAAFWRDDSSPGRERRAATRALGVLARTLHEAGVDQDDFAPNNFLWRPSTPPHVLAIDFERVRLRRKLPRPAWTRQLAKLDRHAIGIHASDRLRLLRAYAGGDPQAARAWWHAVAIEHGALARRDFRHLLRTGTRASRRFVPVTEPGWRGWLRRDASLASVLAAATGPATPAPPGCRARALGDLDARAAARAWAAALTLAQRGCLPQPLALLRREGRAVLVWEPVAGSRALADVDREVARGALVGLLGRLLAFGFEPHALGAADIELVPGRRGGWRALALDPRGLRAGRSPCEAPVRARAWAAALLAALDSASAAK